MQSRLIHIATGDPTTAGEKSHAIPRGLWSYLILVISGTTDAAQTLDEADIGRLRIQRFGDQIQGAKFEYFYDKANLLAGYVHKTAPTAGASRLASMIPFYVNGLPNGLDVADQEEADIFLNFDNTTLATRFGANAAQYELYAKGALVPERYELRVAEQDIVAAGAGRYPVHLNGHNFGAFYLRDASSVVDQVFLEVDDQVVVDNLDDAILLDDTTFRNQVESAAGGLIEIPMVNRGRVQEAYNRNADIDVQFSGAGKLELWKESVIPSAKADASQAQVEAVLRANAQGNVARPSGRPRGARR